MATHTQSSSVSVLDLFVIWWRFHSGAHMNGKKYNDSTWTLPASPRYRIRREAYTWWRRMPRLKRAAWRNGVFFTAVILAAGFYWSPWGMLVVFGAFLPFLTWLAFGRLRLAMFLPSIAYGHDGSVEQKWMLKPKLRRFDLFHKKRRPGLATKDELATTARLREIPDELRGAVEAELVEELDGQPPLELKLLMVPD